MKLEMGEIIIHLELIHHLVLNLNYYSFTPLFWNVKNELIKIDCGWSFIVMRMDFL